MQIWTTYDMVLDIDGRGWITSLRVLGQDILSTPSPLLSLCMGREVLMPISAEAQEDGTLSLEMENGEKVTLLLKTDTLCLTAEALHVPSSADTLVFGPISVTPDEVVGDVIGVVQAGNLAFGMLAGNRKTVEGVPLEVLPEFKRRQKYIDDPGPALGRVQPLFMRAAAWTEGGGASLQFTGENRTRERIGIVAGAPDMLIEALPDGDPDAGIEGAKVLLFGCSRPEVLDRIGQIELAHGLPHPVMDDGEWVKTARHAMKSYLISDFTKEDIDLVLDKAETAGMDTIYHEDPFRTWGHFDWREALAENDDDFRKSIVEKAAVRGMKVGLHTLSNFTTTNDPYVTPIPDDHLVKMARLTLLGSMDEKQTEAFTEKHPCFTLAQSLNAVRIGDEIVTFSRAEDKEEGTLLTG